MKKQGFYVLKISDRIAYYLKSFGRLSTRLHFWLFISTSPPHVQLNFCVATVVREFFDAPAISSLPIKIIDYFNILLNQALCVNIEKNHSLLFDFYLHFVKNEL